MKNVHEVEIKIGGKNWEKILDTVFKKKQKEVKVDGFRKGAVPKDMYIKKFGIESLYMDAVDTAVADAYKEALTDSKLIPVIEPAVDIKSIDEKGVTFVFTITTKPEVKLGDYKNLKVKKETAKVNKEELDAEITTIKDRLAEIVIKEDAEAVLGNTVIIDFKGTVDGKELEGGSGSDYPLELGSHTFIPGFEEGLVGLKAKDTKTLELTFPDNYTEELKNKDVVFEVTVKAVKERVLPDLNEDFYKDLGYEDIKDEKEFRSVVEKQLLEKKEASLEDQYIEDCLARASSNMKVELGEELISEEVHRMIHQYEEQLKMQGLTMEQYMQFTGQTHEQLHEMMNPEAEKRVKYRYLIEAVADKENIEVTDAEAKVEAEKSAVGYGVEVDEFIKMIGGLDMMKYDVRMRKAIEVIKS